MIRPPSPKEIINSTEDSNSAHHQTTIIHRRPINLLRRWPEHENLNNDQVNARENVDESAQQPRYPPGAPDQFTRAAGQVGFLGVGGSRLGSCFDAAGGSPPKEQDAGYEI